MNGLTRDTGDLFTGWTVKPHCHVCWWLMVSISPQWPICEQSTTRPSKYLGLSFNRKKFWFWERGASRSRFQTVFCSPPDLRLLFACFGLLAWETVTGRQLQCENYFSSNRPTFVKNRATIDIKTKASSYENILISDVVALKKYDVRNIALTI